MQNNRRLFAALPPDGLGALCVSDHISHGLTLYLRGVHAYLLRSAVAVSVAAREADLLRLLHTVLLHNVSAVLLRRITHLAISSCYNKPCRRKGVIPGHRLYHISAHILWCTEEWSVPLPPRVLHDPLHE